MALRYFQAQYEIGGAFYGITLNGKYKRNNSTVIARRKSNGIHTNVYSAAIVLFKSKTRFSSLSGERDIKLTSFSILIFVLLVFSAILQISPHPLLQNKVIKK